MAGFFHHSAIILEKGIIISLLEKYFVGRLSSITMLLSQEKQSLYFAFKNLHYLMGLGPLLEGNQAAHPKFERHNGKKHKIQKIIQIGQELVRPAHLKA